jgi:tetratricopeptide (TPR) repeat protein
MTYFGFDVATSDPFGSAGVALAPRARYLEALGRDESLLGQTNQARRSYLAAVQAASAALRAHPKNVDAVQARGFAEDDLGQINAAVRDLRLATALSPHNWALRQVLAQVLYRMGDAAGGRVQIKIAIGLLKGKPGEAHAWETLGNSDYPDGLTYPSRALADDREALVAFHHALGLDPSDTDAHSGLASVLWQTQQLAAARAEYVIVTRQRPHDPVAYYWLATIDGQQGDFAQGIVEIKKQIAINTANAVLLTFDYRTLGIIDIEAGPAHTREAIGAFEHVIALGHPTALDYLILGEAQEQAGNTTAALAAMRKGLALTGGHGSDAQRICRQLAALGQPCSSSSR